MQIPNLKWSFTPCKLFPPKLLQTWIQVSGPTVLSLENGVAQIQFDISQVKSGILFTFKVPDPNENAAPNWFAIVDSGMRNVITLKLTPPSNKPINFRILDHASNPYVWICLIGFFGGRIFQVATRTHAHTKLTFSTKK
jgi:hypothetical protein